MAKNSFDEDEPYPGTKKRNPQDEGQDGFPAPDEQSLTPFEQGGGQAPYEPDAGPMPGDFGGDFGPGGGQAPYEPQVQPDKWYDSDQGAFGAPEGTQFRDPSAPQYGQWAPTNQGFLDWATKTLGASPTRGAGFVDVPGDRQAILKQYEEESGNDAVYGGGPSGDRVDFGQGMQDAFTSGGQIWNAAGGGGGAAPAPGPVGGAPSFGGNNASLPPGLAGPTSMVPQVQPGKTQLQPPQMSDVDKARREQLLRMLGQMGQPFDARNDPNVQAQTGAYAASRNRSADLNRAKMAERAAASGLNSGGQGSGSFDTQLGGIYDDAGRDIAGQESEVIGGEIQARRQEMMQALAMANAVGAQDEAQQIQMQLAQLDDEYRKMALGQQNTQFNQQLGQQGSQFDKNLGYQYANLGQQGSQFQQNLNQQQNQWNDQYGLNLQQLLYGMDRDTMLQMLQGGGG